MVYKQQLRYFTYELEYPAKLNIMNWNYYPWFIEAELGQKKVKKLASKCLLLQDYDNS